MRYYKPELALGVLLPPQTERTDKFGGLPWGLPPERWPLCSYCGKPLSHLFELEHHPERLDLGAPGRVAFVFQCNHDPGGCPTWESGSGANAVLILEPEEIGQGLTEPPASGAQMEPEARVVRWVALDDLVSEQDYDKFFDDDAPGSLPDEVNDSVYAGTKLGGVPTWIQSASEAPGPPYRFAGQFDCYHEFAGPAPDADAVGCTITLTVAEDDSCFQCDAANYGDAGEAYLFIHADPERPSGLFLWQCG